LPAPGIIGMDVARNNLQPPFLLHTTTEPEEDDDMATSIGWDPQDSTQWHIQGNTAVQITPETFNTLKNQGYYFEHNFGHGKHHLSATLLTLNVLAFLFHTVLQLVDERYQAMRKKRGTRKGFFQDICSLTKYLLFDSWQGLIDFMLYGESLPQTVNSS
jgi:hypothetical protein